MDSKTVLADKSARSPFPAIKDRTLTSARNRTDRQKPTNDTRLKTHAVGRIEAVRRYKNRAQSAKLITALRTGLNNSIDRAHRAAEGDA